MGQGCGSGVVGRGAGVGWGDGTWVVEESAIWKRCALIHQHADWRVFDSPFGEISNNDTRASSHLPDPFFCPHAWFFMGRRLARFASASVPGSSANLPQH